MAASPFSSPAFSVETRFQDSVLRKEQVSRAGSIAMTQPTRAHLENYKQKERFTSGYGAHTGVGHIQRAWGYVEYLSASVLFVGSCDTENCDFKMVNDTTRLVDFPHHQEAQEK